MRGQPHCREDRSSTLKARLCSVRAALRKLGREPDARARLREWLAVFEDMGEDERAAEGRAELLG
jgi:hypothetical protein